MKERLTLLKSRLCSFLKRKLKIYNMLFGFAFIKNKREKIAHFNKATRANSSLCSSLKRKLKIYICNAFWLCFKKKKKGKLLSSQQEQFARVALYSISDSLFMKEPFILLKSGLCSYLKSKLKVYMTCFALFVKN